MFLFKKLKYMYNYIVIFHRMRYIIEDKLTENEYLIYTLAVLPELVFCHGFGILKNIYEGTFDEADLGNEQIPEWYQSKIRLETLSGEFFRDLLLYFIWWMILSIYAIGCFFI